MTRPKAAPMTPIPPTGKTGGGVDDARPWEAAGNNRELPDNMNQHIPTTDASTYYHAAPGSGVA